MAISTLEHVGLDEHYPDPGKALRAVHVLRGLLATRRAAGADGAGRLQPELRRRDPQRRGPDRGPRRRSDARPGRRVARVAPEEAWDAPYDFLLYRARGVLFARLEAALRHGGLYRARRHDPLDRHRCGGAQRPSLPHRHGQQRQRCRYTLR